MPHICIVIADLRLSLLSTQVPLHRFRHRIALLELHQNGVSTWMNANDGWRYNVTHLCTAYLPVPETRRGLQAGYTAPLVSTNGRAVLTWTLDGQCFFMRTTLRKWYPLPVTPHFFPINLLLGAGHLNIPTPRFPRDSESFKHNPITIMPSIIHIYVLAIAALTVFAALVPISVDPAEGALQARGEFKHVMKKIGTGVLEGATALISPWSGPTLMSGLT
ncbi:hypothetical protein DACRYDRAFT_24278 [Dacryopinax primogenitus]|uniref:Uncharacterized protein n=1 Tax=Dacryopinax primogenitus (strain DJM 731) TaxID=1858805 RepID=M5FSB0_DACPD|nr:uncharacterized protein DACRYDRAFT_24278 [Dacryopinax primogenitus]EJT98688.1 hypothetical protein DACRYDRAFT_24278 [Dacryopinax primogenitus]